MRTEVTKQRLQALMKEIARTAPRERSYRVYLVGGGTAVFFGWRSSSIDADLFVEDESVLRDIQGIKERLDINVEFVRREHFVPELPGSGGRHAFIETIGKVSYYHYDPYAQALSEIVRGFERDIADARQLVESGLVSPEELLALVRSVPDSAYAHYPRLSRREVTAAVEAFVEERR